MTEGEWSACTDPEPMLNFLRGKASGRKLRLFAVACCRLLLSKIPLHPWYAHGLEVAEQFADGNTTADDLERVNHYPDSEWCLQFAPHHDPNAAIAAGHSHRVVKMAINACWNATEAESGVLIADCASLNAAWAATQPGAIMPDDGGVSAARLVAERALQCGILQDIVGNPFRPLPSIGLFILTWNGGAIPKLARALYEERELLSGHLDRVRLMILGDMLEDAGCTAAEILGHCRGPGPHVRGCFALDAVLGSS